METGGTGAATAARRRARRSGTSTPAVSRPREPFAGIDSNRDGFLSVEEVRSQPRPSRRSVAQHRSPSSTAWVRRKLSSRPRSAPPISSARWTPTEFGMERVVSPAEHGAAGKSERGNGFSLHERHPRGSGPQLRPAGKQPRVDYRTMVQRHRARPQLRQRRALRTRWRSLSTARIGRRASAVKPATVTARATVAFSPETPRAGLRQRDSRRRSPSRRRHRRQAGSSLARPG